MEMVLYRRKQEKCFYKTLYNIKNVDWNMGLWGPVGVHQKMAPCMVTTVSISELPHFVKGMIFKCAPDKLILL
jgi:hypothetical protein